MSETVEQKIARVLSEDVAIQAYDPTWPESFRRERDYLLSCLPNDLLGRIEHFGSTAVPGLAAKPIVDMLVEVTDLEAAKSRIVPLLEGQGYDYFWRATKGEDGVAVLSRSGNVRMSAIGSPARSRPAIWLTQ